MAENKKREEEIDQTRSDEMASRPKAVRDAAEERKIQREIARCVLRATKTGDARSLARQLRQAGVDEGSDVWKKVWEIFRASSQRK